MRYPITLTLADLALRGVGDNSTVLVGVGDRASYSLAKPIELENKARVLEMVVATPGMMEYPQGVAYVPASTLMDEAYLNGFAGLPFLVDDPSVHASGSGGVAVDDPRYPHLRLGIILRSWWDEAEQAQKAQVVIDDLSAYEAMKGGIIGVSPYYYPTIDPTPGMVDGQRYDFIQSARARPDHIVLTDSARGSDAHVYVGDSTAGDAADVDVAALRESMGLGDNSGPAPLPGGSAMDLKKLLAALAAKGVEVPASAADSEDPNALADAILASARADVGDMEQKIADMETANEELRAEADADHTAAHRLAWRQVEVAAKAAKVDIADDVSLTDAQALCITGLGGTGDSVPAGQRSVFLSGLVAALRSETFQGLRPTVVVEEGTGDSANDGNNAASDGITDHNFDAPQEA